MGETFRMDRGFHRKRNDDERDPAVTSDGLSLAFASNRAGSLGIHHLEDIGIHYAPNTYVGTGFSNWSNLSSGVVTPNPLGGWNYSTR